MAIYKQLSIASGGGIISTSQQAEQVENTATVLIGLGGTGMDCLRTIKTQIYSRLKPDDPNAVNKTYKHIRFLGVDTDESSNGSGEENDDGAKAGATEALMALDGTEMFSLANPNVRSALTGPGVRQRRELNWMRHEDMPIPDLTARGAGGIRQVGRFMMMDKAQQFAATLKQTIDSAKEGLTAKNINVNIHIFSGIGGGTGSGTFLDVCYLTRYVAANQNATVFGYVFLPDVNLAKVSDQLVRSYIVKNGYAALQEIDYCMQLQYNGGGFQQEYGGIGLVPWVQPPVDMCHLVCATNESGHVIPNAYNYSMHVTSEYIMDFLTKSASFSMESNIANFQQKVKQADEKKQIGSYLGYCVIGAACARLPLREINTYLASELFEKFSCIGTNTPSKADVERLAIESMAPGQQNVSAIYDSLWRQVCNGATADFPEYQGTHKDVATYGNQDMILHYDNELARKRNLIETGMKGLASELNEKSLLGRMKSYLADVIGDVNRGPNFAYRMLEAGQKQNLLNFIDGLIADNKSRWDLEAIQKREDEYNFAKTQFERKPNKKNYQEYRYRLLVWEQHDFYMTVFSQINDLLKTFKEQVIKITKTYYIKLDRVMKNLLETFRENRETLNDKQMLQNTDAFAEPLMTIQELKETLLKAVEEIHVPSIMQAFMGLFLNPENEKKWLEENESEITKLVTDFFVKRAFADFANRSITEFLKDKYNTTTDDELANKVYREWMVRLTNRASPLFHRDGGVPIPMIGDTGVLSFPSTSAPVAAAVKKTQDEIKGTFTWEPKPSDLTDRIFAMRSACALPLAAYQDCKSFEREYFEAVSSGRHYYEGKPIEGMIFDDWRNLPSLTPFSLLDLDNVPFQLAEQTKAASDLYDKAAGYGLFSRENKLNRPAESAVAELKKKAAAAVEMAAKLRHMDQVPAAEEMMQELRKAKQELPMISTEYGMAEDGDRNREDDRLKVQKDHFVSAPVFQIRIRETIAELEALFAEVDAAVQKLDEAAKKLNNPDQPAFLNALFTGVIRLAGRKVTYLPEDAFDEDDAEVLSEYSDQFKFKDIPVYQAFVSFQALSDDVKKEISKRTNELLNDEDPSIAEVTKALADSLSDKKIGVWAKMARELPGSGDITDFLKKLKERFEVHKMQYLDD